MSNNPRYISPEVYPELHPAARHHFATTECADCGWEGRAIDMDGVRLLEKTHARIHLEGETVSKRSSYR